MDWNTIDIASKREPELTKNARIVLEKRYLAKDDKGRIIETPVELPGPQRLEHDLRPDARGVAQRDPNAGTIWHLLRTPGYTPWRGGLSPIPPASWRVAPAGGSSRCRLEPQRAESYARASHRRPRGYNNLPPSQ